MHILATWIPENPLKQENNDIDHLPVVKITQYEYEYLKRRSKRLEILERAFLECRREEVNDYPTCSFIPDKNSQEDK
ncbi:hypothetical protein P7J55_10175 [Streptococcus suis]|uniref:hypothetical protein n=1 Tax=Streptococcus suis TaxID=1307 RepID=UPI0038B7DE4F